MGAGPLPRVLGVRMGACQAPVLSHRPVHCLMLQLCFPQGTSPWAVGSSVLVLLLFLERTEDISVGCCSSLLTSPWIWLHTPLLFFLIPSSSLGLAPPSPSLWGSHDPPLLPPSLGILNSRRHGRQSRVEGILDQAITLSPFWLMACSVPATDALKHPCTHPAWDLLREDCKHKQTLL